MTISRTLPCLLLAAFLAACGGPSDFFRGLDTDANGSIGLDEWMAYYAGHEHAWENCSGHDFEPADCDNDLSLSWPEYRSARFDGDYCGDSNAHLTVYQKPVFDSQTQKYVTLPPACELAIPADPSVASAPAIAGSNGTSSLCRDFGRAVVP